MKVATPKDRVVIDQLVEFYRYDMSGFEQEDVDIHGRFGFNYLDYYLASDPGFAYIIMVDNNFAGFALVNNDDPYVPHFELVAFFIMKKYRNSNVGSVALKQVLKLHEGAFTISVLAQNKKGVQFFTKVLTDCVLKYEDSIVEGDRVFVFWSAFK